MSVGWNRNSRIWQPAAASGSTSVLQLPSSSGIECWHFTDLSTGLVGLIDGTTLTATTTHVTLEESPRFSRARGLHFNGAGRLAGANSNLRILGDVTLECIAHFHEPQSESGGVAVIMTYMAVGETENTNCLYQISTNQIQGGGILWFSERDDGVNTDTTFSTNDSIPIGRPFYIAATRISNVIRIYIDGILFATSGTITAPTGGDSAAMRVCFAGNLDGFFGHMTLWSARIHSSGLNGAQILSNYNETLGQIYPLPSS